MKRGQQHTSGLEPGPEGRVNGIPPVWGHGKPQCYHPERLAGTNNIPVVQCFLAMFLQRKEHVHDNIAYPQVSETILREVAEQTDGKHLHINNALFQSAPLRDTMTPGTLFHIRKDQ